MSRRIALRETGDAPKAPPDLRLGSAALGAWAGVTLLGPLFVLGPNHLGWILFIAVPGALLPGLLIRIFGIKQSKAVLEHVSH